jgi:hypothetical protein
MESRFFNPAIPHSLTALPGIARGAAPSHHAAAMTPLRLLLLASAFAASAAPAAELRDFCPTRPGLGTAPCIVYPGHLVAELGFADWTLERDPATRTDTLVTGETLLRYGLTDDSELQLGWAGLGHVRTRDRLTGAVSAATRAGDLLLSFKQSLRNPSGDGLSVAVQPFVTLPLGRAPIGAGDWGGGLLVPIAIELSQALQLQMTPEVDAAVDGDGHGRHLAYGDVLGLGIAASPSVSLTVETAATRDLDPAGHSTVYLAGLSAAWQPSGSLQLDLGTAIGLSRRSPDVELAAGISRRF